MKTLRTLCSGGELFGVGARAAGWQHVDGWEIDPSITAVARLNGFQVNVADVCAVDYASLSYADHLHASPSCKTASQANTDGGEAPEDLAVADAVACAIRAHQGKTASLENVWGYRNYESFARILAALHEEGFQVDYRHVNAADYGVPQTRKRLILRAVRGARVPPLHPTHRRGGDMFHATWRGWYEAIADLLPGLPDTTPATWQLARLPGELKETILFGQNDSHDQKGNSYGIGGRDSNTPAFTVTANSNQTGLRAFIVSNAATEYGDGLRDDSEPMFSVTTQHAGRLRAFLVESKNANQEYGDGLRGMDEPATTVITDHKPSHQPIALLVGDQAGAAGEGLQVADADMPAFTVRTNATGGARPLSYVCGVWKRLTVQALGRFQTVPDLYIGLTPQINGNGVPCLLAQRIMESLE